MLGLGNHPRRRKLNIAAMPNCEWWIDASRPETLTYTSGTNVSQIADLSGKGRHLSKTNAGNPTVYPTYVAAEKAVYFAGNNLDQMCAGAAGDWNFLHNGNGCTVLLLVKIDSAQAANGVMLSTSSEASTGIGTNIWYYNTSQQYQITTRNGSAQVYTNPGATNSLPRTASTIISLHIANRTGNPPDIVTRYNGLTDLRTGPFSTYSASNSTSGLFVSRLSDTSWKCKFYLKKCAIFSRRISKAEENAILDAWAKDEGIAITRYGTRAVAVLSGQSNATGRGTIAGTSFATTATVPNAQIFNSSGFSWNALTAGSTNLAYDSNSLGLEMNLALQYTTLSGRPLNIVKSTADGTSITSWVSSNSNFINLQAAMQRAQWDLEDQGYVIKPFFIWYQGETDAQASDTAAAYEGRLQSFLSQILATPGYEQAPTYLVQISQVPAFTDTATVQNAALHTSVTIPYSAYAHYLETADIAVNFEQNHINGTSQCALGDRIARRVLGTAG